MKLVILIVFSIILCIVSHILNYSLIYMPSENISEYHMGILTVNSIFCGFALTNLGILLSITDDQLIKKLEGTDILQKRNIVIGHSIIFGAVSCLLSIFWVLRVNFSFLNIFFSKELLAIFKEFFFYVEVFSLVFSILYFILSVKKMIELLSLIHIPKKRYTEEQIENMKRKIHKEK